MSNNEIDRGNASNELRSVQPPPTPMARSLVRYIVGFGVSVAIGLAPYLGKVGIPGFDALLTLLPRNVQSVALPVSAAVMGILAVWVQWSGYDHLSQKWLRRSFKRTLALFFTGLIALVIIHSFVVVRVEVPAVQDTVSFLVGFVRPYEEPCTRSVSNAECIMNLTFSEARIAAYWGDSQIRLAQLSLLSAYVMTTGAFGLSVGLLLLLQELLRKKSA